MKTRSKIWSLYLGTIVVASLMLASCGPQPTAVPTPIQTPVATIPPIKTIAPSPTAAPVALPALTWHPGDSYLSLNGRPAFLFSRNLAGYVPDDLATLAGMAHQQGNQFVRVYTSTTSMGGDHGYGYTPNGEIREDWSNNWEHFFDVAEADGLYVLPSFEGWIEWNDTGYNTWASNPFNSANGGPAKDARDFFTKDSPTQQLYLKWFKHLVTRWQAHKNILAWEVVAEVNLIQGISQPEGIYLAQQLAKIVREGDTLHRPITASVADWSGWSDFLSSDAVDFINFHPYPPDGTLDRRILDQVPLLMSTYHKPVLIGESGLNAATPDSADGKITLAPNARTGIQHAIWAELVSGAMNGRALWWEDSYGIYFPALGMPWVRKYTDVEAAAARFDQGVDRTGFKSITARASGKIFGAALGNEKTIIGWYRDATSEPPDWNLQPVVSKQTVAVTVPGSASLWKVDFYNAKDGTTLLSSASIASQGSTITILLPDFQDDIAFKMTAQARTASTSAPAMVTTDAIAGTWSGTISNLAGTFSTALKLSIQAGCTPGKNCGSFSAPQLPCSGDLFLQTINSETFIFLEQNVSGAASCKSGGIEQLQLLPDGTLSYAYLSTPGSAATSTGILKNP
jgi:hypothetical protein